MSEGNDGNNQEKVVSLSAIRDERRFKALSNQAQLFLQPLEAFAIASASIHANLRALEESLGRSLALASQSSLQSPTQNALISTHLFSCKELLDAKKDGGTVADRLALFATHLESIASVLLQILDEPASKHANDNHQVVTAIRTFLDKRTVSDELHASLGKTLESMDFLETAGKIIANSSLVVQMHVQSGVADLIQTQKMDTIPNAVERMGAIGDVIADAHRVLESSDSSLGTLASRLRTAEDLLSKAATDFLDLYDDASRA